MISLNEFIAKYDEIRSALPSGKILLAKCGDYWYIYGDEAYRCAEALGKVVTNRNIGDCVKGTGFSYYTELEDKKRLLDAGIDFESVIIEDR